MTLAFLVTALLSCGLAEAQSPPSSTYLTGTGPNQVDLGDGNFGYSIVCNAYAPPTTGNLETKGQVDWILWIDWDGMSTDAPTATGSVTADFQVAAAASAGSHVGCSSHSSSSADIVSNSAAASGADVSTPPTQSTIEPATVEGSDLTFTLYEGSWEAIWNYLPSNSLDAKASATAPSGSKGSFASASASAASTGNYGITNNTLEITGD